MTDIIMWGANLATVEEIRNSAWLTSNINIWDDFISVYMLKANGDVWTYISWRYNLKSFTKDRFMGSTAFNFIKWSIILLASAYLLNEWYGSQRLNEENGSKTKYDQQMAMLDDVRKGNTRLLDKNLDEFDLLPKSPNKTTPSTVSSSFSSDVQPNGDTRNFRVWDLR